MKKLKLLGLIIANVMGLVSAQQTSAQAVLFDEDYTSTSGTLEYLYSDTPGMPGSVGTDYENTEVLLHRTFQTGSKWNTFVFPLDLTTEQVKAAFGENVVIAEPVGVGSMSNNPMVIDFETKILRAGDIAISAGVFYIIKGVGIPKNGTVEITDGSGATKSYTGNYYSLGKHEFNPRRFKEIGTKYTGKGGDDSDTHNTISSSGTYVKSEAPVGAYVFSEGDMYHLTEPKAIKGFRGWIYDNCDDTSSSSFSSYRVFVGSEEDPVEPESAYDCKVNGIYYNLNKTARTASVTYANNNYGSYSGSVTIPSSFTYNGITYRVTSIGVEAFRNCSNLTFVSIPNSVTSIGDCAFQGCTNLSDITTEITDVFVTGTSAFLGCENATLRVPAGTYVAYSGRADWNRIMHIVEVLEGIDLKMACNTKGRVLVNDKTIFTNKIAEVEVKENEENTFVFVPKENCKLEQVVLNGLDVTASVENNTLKAVIPANSQMNVVFSKAGDMNSDGNIDISDVVSLVNMILGQ